MMYKKILTLFGIITSTVCLSQEETNFDVESFPLEEIINNATSCIKKYHNNRIYLKEDKIFPTEKGMYLVLNESGEYTHLPRLLSDNSGCFIEVVNEISDKTSIKVFNDCPRCGEEYFIQCNSEKCVSERKDKEKDKKKDKDKEKEREKDKDKKKDKEKKDKKNK